MGGFGHMKYVPAMQCNWNGTGFRDSHKARGMMSQTEAGRQSEFKFKSDRLSPDAEGSDNRISARIDQKRHRADLQWPIEVSGRYCDYATV